MRFLFSLGFEYFINYLGLDIKNVKDYKQSIRMFNRYNFYEF